jgi:hypothetical protein
MAEIRVEPKRRSLAWLWTLLALALVALVAWYLMNGGVRTVDDDDATTTPRRPARRRRCRRPRRRSPEEARMARSDNTRGLRDEANVGPDPRSARELKRLSDMRYEVTDGDPDIRGWAVWASTGRELGVVDDLLVDVEAGEVVMVDVDLKRDDRHAYARCARRGSTTPRAASCSTRAPWRGRSATSRSRAAARAARSPTTTSTASTTATPAPGATAARSATTTGASATATTSCASAGRGAPARAGSRAGSPPARPPARRG